MNQGSSVTEDVATRNKGIGVWDIQTCDPELPHDTAEDIFLEAKMKTKLPERLAPFAVTINLWSLDVFRQFWSDYEAQEGGGHSSRTFGDEAVIRLLHAVTNSYDRTTAMRAECFLAVINRKPESQTAIAKKYDVTRAAVSKICIQIVKEFGLNKARHMKSDEAVISYRKRALQKHKERKQQTCKLPTFNSFSRLSTLRSALMQSLVHAS
jgi:hypothetical protein